MSSQENQHAGKLPPAYISHIPAHHRFLIDIGARRVGDPAIFHPGSKFCAQGFANSPVPEFNIPVYPKTCVIFREQYMRVHLGISGKQSGIKTFPAFSRTGRDVTDCKLPYLPYANPVRCLLPRAHKTNIINIGARHKRLSQLIITTYYTGIYNYSFHSSPSLKSHLSGSNGTSPRQ